MATVRTGVGNIMVGIDGGNLWAVTKIATTKATSVTGGNIKEMTKTWVGAYWKRSDIIWRS